MTGPASKLMLSRFIRSRFIDPKFAASPVAAAAPAATITFTDESVSTSDAATYNFLSQALGSGTTADHIIVAVVGLGNNAFTLNSVTVDGQAATIVVGANSVTVDAIPVGAAIAIAPATANATGTVSIGFSTGLTRAAIGIYRATNLQSTTPVDTGADTGNAPSDTLNISAGGIAVGVVNSNSSGSAWTGLTERYEATVESNTVHTGAADAFASAQVGLAISNNTTTRVIMALASFR